MYYVGLATDLRTRVKQHLKDRHSDKWDTFSLYLIKNVHFLKELESLILHITHPKGNVQRGRFAKSLDLLPVLDGMMTARDRRKRESILDTAARRKRLPASGKSVRPRNLENDPPLVLKPGMKQQAVYKGVLYGARVDQSGRIRYGGKLFPSPSTAGSFIRSGKSTNGWVFWKYQTPDGHWRYIDELRNR
ncbi:MAG TPA: hypothetical protein PLG25_02435 [bacterium]|nr:hypothetical protein [bacterium]HMW33319.1 hypothetical protein [bacterium]HMW35599.1 hypothetical protein [bacterium]HMZ03963.1 hypothetical protein [bacterium]HNE82702.1 hypothetical protein [bacterium]